jgi:hypothetical protein
VPPLDEAAIRVLVERSARRAGALPTEAAVAAAASFCGGLPMLAELAGIGLARGWVAAGAGQPLAARILAADPLERRVLGLVVAHDGWLARDTLASLSDAAPGAVDDSLHLLEQDGILKLSADREGRVQTDFYHDALREASVRGLDPKLVVEAHGRFADLYESMPGAFDRQRVRHLLGAGRAGAAAALAPRAAEQAVSEHAYSLAADLLLVAVEHEEKPTIQISLLRRRAEVLERAARYAEAADCWRRLVDASSGEARVDATIHEAHALLAAHQVSRGAERLEHAMQLTGEPPATARAVLDLIALGRFLLGPS